MPIFRPRLTAMMMLYTIMHVMQSASIHKSDIVLEKCGKLRIKEIINVTAASANIIPPTNAVLTRTPLQLSFHASLSGGKYRAPRRMSAGRINTP